MIRSDPINDVLARPQITRVGTPVQLVLQCVLYLVLEVFGDVVPVGDVPDARQGNCLHELVGERGQVRLDASDNEAVILRLEFLIELFMQAIGDACMMVWSEVPLLTTVDVARRDKVQEGRDGCQALRLKPAHVLVLVGNVRCYFEFLPPRRALRVLLDYALDQVLSLLTQLSWLSVCFNHISVIELLAFSQDSKFLIINAYVTCVLISAPEITNISLYII